MIEVFDINRTISLGRFVNFRAAKYMLSGLVDARKLGQKPAVLVCSYRNNEPQREYIATYDGKWHVPRFKISHPVLEVRTKCRHRKRLCKEYPSSEAVFNEGLPDWMNRSYPVTACIHQGLNQR